MRKINIVFEIPDNDLVEFNFEKAIRGQFNVVDYQVLPDTKNLYENDTHFKSLTKKYYEIKKLRNDYINEKNFKNER